MAMTNMKSTMMRTTMTTDHPSWPTNPPRGDEHLDRVRRQMITVHGLRDPLGAKGFRISRDRIRREGQARRLVTVAAIGSFVAAFGLIVQTTPVATPIVADVSPQHATGNTNSIVGASIRASDVIRLEPTAVSGRSHTRSRSS